MLEEKILNEIIELLKVNANGEYSSREIIESLNLDLTPRKLTQELLKNENSAICYLNNTSPYRFYYEGDRIVSMRKEKNLLIFTTFTDDEYIYDFNTSKLNKSYPYSHRMSGRDDLTLILCRIEDSTKGSYYKPVEWIFSLFLSKEIDIDNIYCLFEDGLKESLQGYVPYLKENNLKLSLESYRDYKRILSAKKYGVNPRILENLDRKIGGELTEYVLKNNLLKDLTKMYINDAKNFDSSAGFFDLISTYRTIKKSYQTDFTFDTNRGSLFNYNLLKEMKNKEYNNILANNLQLLNRINNKEYGDYVVIVPQNIQDLATEGRNQNNCVGYFYNNSIVDGANLIYFLRNKDNPEKSYVTCRFNASQNRTVETRLVNNRSYSSPIFAEIDKDIRKILSDLE